MTDQQAHLAGIIANPDDDLPRLVYADWLDENPSDPCPKCGGSGYYGKADHDNPLSSYSPDELTPEGLPKARCRKCDGSGRVSNGNAARAEFIRVQIDLVKMRGQVSGAGEGHPKGCDCPYCVLRRREKELFARNALHWFETNDIYSVRLAPYPEDEHHPRWYFVFRRGFVDEVRTTLADWIVTLCPRCEGRGHLPTPTGMAPFMPIRCPACSGGGHIDWIYRPSAIGPAVVAAHPVRVVILTDHQPFVEFAHQHPNPLNRPPDDTGSEIWRWESELAHLFPDGLTDHATEAEALSAMSDRLIAVAKAGVADPRPAGLT